MEAVGIAGLIAVIYKLVDFLKYISARDVNAIVTQASVWLSSFAVALLAREAEPFSAIGILGTTFGDLDLAAVLLIALGVGSTASGVVDFRKAFDHSDSAKTPPLLPTATPTTATPPTATVEVL